MRRKGWLLLLAWCMGYCSQACHQPGMTGNASEGLLFPQHSMLTTATKTFLAPRMVSWPSLCTAPTFPFPLVLLHPPLLPPPLVSVLSCPCFGLSSMRYSKTWRAGDRQREYQAGSCPLTAFMPLLGRWHLTMHSNGVDTTQGSSS